MAVQFERNVNLEEIDSDALFGIQYLSHQTMSQKVILWGNVIIAAASFIVTQMIYHFPFFVSFIISTVFVGVGFLFGANQSEHLTVGGYLKLVFFKPVKYVNYMSSEDVYVMKDEAEKLKTEAERQEKLRSEVTPEGQRRSLLMVVLLIVGFMSFAFILLGLKSYKQSHMQHHTIGYVTEELAG